MELIHFKISGKFGHFLRAETNVSMPSYPFPPRTVLLGLIGAILGLNKDSPQVLLEPAYISVKGKLPSSFWVTNKFHQSLPAPLSYVIKKNAKGSDSEMKNQKILTQEWLFNPEYEVWAALPEKYHGEFSQRLKDRRWYFSPYLGITEHMADISWIENIVGNKLYENEHIIESICPRSAGTINVKTVLDKGYALHFVRMPVTVSSDRVFSHRDYFFERLGRPVPVITSQAVLAGEQKIVFM